MKTIEGLCAKCKEYSSATLEHEDDEVMSDCCSAALLCPENGYGADFLSDDE